ncbi:conserved hypothetical protein [Candidatus Terasakiella magnetica]|uniref:Glycosyltransferase n=1 Tax=Candidatus Terasakiella magnetica TaxID=1867952 RepID=A0A1C3RLP0_9PROT|nr:conserved hypothetical protein [Candidatus Terasakiella magnetica]
MNPYVITWGVSDKHGWGLIGVHLSLHLMKLGRNPLLVTPAVDISRPEYAEKIMPLNSSVQMFQDAFASAPNQKVMSDQMDVLHGTGNDFMETEEGRRTWGKRNICMTFFEEQLMDEANMARANRFDGIVTGSTYNYELLKNAGLDHVYLSFQGIDPYELVPKKASGRFGDKFVVFSGGKLEYRKGQDLVVKAFKIFHERHPDSLLLTNWVNFWPEVARGVNESCTLEVDLNPDLGPDYMTQWAVANGIPSEAFVDLGVMKRASLSQLFADVDVALFPNRCEGGTNLVCNETMFCRVPTILSANTGHLDMMPEDKDVCIALKKQTALDEQGGKRMGWMESDIEEMVEALEYAYQNREETQKMARRAASFVGRERTWQGFAKDCVAIFDKI